VVLEPNKYPKHAKAVEKLRADSGRWKETEKTELKKPEPESEAEPTSEVLLPHQARAIEEIRRNRENFTHSTETTK